MQISRRKLNKNIEKQIADIFFRLLADAKSNEEIKILLTGLLSETEIQVMMKRLAIAIFLDKKRSYENIKNTLKVSSATIANVQEKMGSVGVDLALRKIKADAWADEWMDKISGLVGRLLPAK